MSELDVVSINISPVMSYIRIYDREDGYNDRLPYVGIMTAHYLSPNTVYLSGAHGVMTREIYGRITAMLKEQGVEKLMFERRGKFVTRDI